MHDLGELALAVASCHCPKQESLSLIFFAPHSVLPRAWGRAAWGEEREFGIRLGRLASSVDGCRIISGHGNKLTKDVAVVTAGTMTTPPATFLNKIV
jgi:hypothetical protein